MIPEPSTSANKPQPTQQTIHLAKPLGQTGIVALVCGLIGALLGIIVDFLNVLQPLTQALQRVYISEPFLLTNIDRPLYILDWTIALALAIGIGYAVLDSCGKWRRIVILLMVLSLLIMLSPLLMLWNIFWIPVSACIAVTWSWICAYTYTCMHIMPCELGVPLKVSKKKRVHQRLLQLKQLIKLRRKKHKLQTTPLHKSETVAELEQEIEEVIVHDLEKELAEAESEVKIEFQTFETEVKSQLKPDA